MTGLRWLHEHHPKPTRALQALDLAGSREWTVDQIAAELRVSRSTVKADLEACREAWDAAQTLTAYHRWREERRSQRRDARGRYARSAVHAVPVELGEAMG